jgi:hypothetical protein
MPKKRLGDEQTVTKLRLGHASKLLAPRLMGRVAMPNRLASLSNIPARRQIQFNLPQCLQAILIRTLVSSHPKFLPLTPT